MKLFVYGSLLGNFYASRLIPETSLRRSARAIGRLYDCINRGFPAVVLPSDLIRATGSQDYTKDEMTEQSQTPISSGDFDHLFCEKQNDDYGWIYGEVAEISDVHGIMPNIDRYEGFNPEHLLYHRSLVPVKMQDEISWAWIYHFLSEEGLKQSGINIKRIAHGSWPELVWTNRYEH